ncbi:hypothetical protein F5I97DRAFT_1807216 [Phlebopus sp. FC_14]|nr:hypothetical protein F5I97DRAFT_1807216 [Phlebopus sp. FC_14]
MSRSLFYCSTLPSSTQVALKCAGYETVDDLAGISAEALSKELGIAITDCRDLISATQAPKGPPMSQSVSSMSRTNIVKCSYPCVNKVLGGGLPRGHILEISGPPGCFKETLACDFARTFVEVEEEVIFTDMQNMTSPEAICRIFENSPTPSDYQALVSYTRLHTLPDLLVFLQNLLSFLRPRTGLLVLNSISFAFQSHPDLMPSRKTALLDNIRRDLLEASVSRNLTIIITSQMATKILNADGSPATFDSGAKAVMAPQLGPSYLPSGRSYRMIIVPDSRTSGAVRLLSSPAGQQPTLPEENYVLVGINYRNLYDS